MVWPFARARGERHNDGQQAQALPAERVIPASAEPAPPASDADRQSAERKRRRSTDYPFDRGSIQQEKTIQHRSRISVEDITALPGAQRLETSPHLRQSRLLNTAIPYNSTSSAGNMSREEKQQRRLSKRQIYHDRAIREEEIRAMSTPVAIPKRNFPHGDMLLREEKKARRPFSRGQEDKRDSTISLPFQESIHSSMSTGSESRFGIPKMNIFNPRPSIKVQSSLGQLTSSGPVPRLYRAGSKRKDKEKRPASRDGRKKKDRRKIADLADDLDAADLRAAMERESRRREKKEAANRDKLASKLRRRMSRTRTNMTDPMPDITQHPAFRGQAQAERSPSRGRTMTNGNTEQVNGAATPRAENPFRDPSPSLFADPDRLPVTPGDMPGTPGGIPTPLGSTFDDAVLVTAEEVRYSHGRLSQIDMVPPDPAFRNSTVRSASPLQREFTPDSQPASSPLRADSADARKSSWMGYFRRTSTRSPPQQVGTSFSNVSRDSMSRTVPSHLIASQPRRRSGTPARTTSIFREDLPSTRSVEPELVIMPTDAELGTSLASVDSEASWISPKRARESNGTAASFEDLGARRVSGSAENGGVDGVRRSTSVRRPTLVLREEKEGMAAVMGGQTPVTATHEDAGSVAETDSEYEGSGGEEVVYGHGRQISTGSAKLLDIPSRTRSGRWTERGSVVEEGKRWSGLRTPPPEVGEIVLEP